MYSLQQFLFLFLPSVFLQDPNQLIRASALRVLSSIRVTIIVPIMMLAIKEAASDMSPYVRKTAAHAIPKLYRYEILPLQLYRCFSIASIEGLVYFPLCIETARALTVMTVKATAFAS